MWKEFRGIIRKADILLLTGIVLLCAAVSVWAYNEGGAGAIVKVEVDGVLYGTYSLEEDQVVDIDSSGGHNQLTIREGKAFMSEATCPDQYCLDQHRSTGGIDKSNQSLICLPNRVVVTVEGGSAEETDGIDAIAGTPDRGKQL